MSSEASFSNFLLCLDAKDLNTVCNLFNKKSKLINKEAFCELLSKNLSKGNVSDYERLFDAVDSLQSGMLNWNSLCDFLLLKFYEQDEKRTAIQVPEWKTVEFVPIFHKKSICRILQCKQYYYVVSTDGHVSFLSKILEVEYSIKLKASIEDVKLKNLWVTDAIFMENLNKFAFSTTKKELLFYGISPPKDADCQCKFYKLDAVPLSLAYRLDKDKTNQGILAYGDTDGNIHVIYFESCALFGKLQNSDDQLKMNNTFTINEIANGAVPSVSYIKYNAHTNWVCNIMHVPYLQCIASCSASNLDSLIIAWLGKKRSDLKLTKFSVSLGVNGFDYHKKLNVIATAGIDSNVCLWNPYLGIKPVGVLRAHHQAVVGVKFIYEKYQLVSLSKDRVLCLWDVNLQQCLQKLFCLFPKGPDVNITMHFSMEDFCLLVSINNQLAVLKTRSKSLKTSHEKPVKDLVYNPKFGYVISVCEESSVSIWLLTTGQKVRTIVNAHDGAEITSVILGDDKKCFLTAGIDGKIKIWDMNETDHQDLFVDNVKPLQISKILFLRKMIIVIGWSKDLWCIPFSINNNHYCQAAVWKGKPEHSDEIVVADVQEPNYLVTGSYDGDIVVWDTETRNALKKISNKHVSISNISENCFLKLPSINEHCLTSIEKSIVHPLKVSHENSATLKDKKPLPKSEHVVSVTSIKFLNNQNKKNQEVPDFYTCHYDGSVMFWDAGIKVCEFKAFESNGQLVSDIDSTNSFLCIGSKNGACKVWNTSAFFNSNSSPTSEQTPELISCFTPHNEQVTVVKFAERKNNLFLLSASDDRTIALHYFDKLIGVFGQEPSWNISDATFNFKMTSFGKQENKIESNNTNLTKDPPLDPLLKLEINKSPVHETSADILQKARSFLDNPFQKIDSALHSLKGVNAKQRQSFKTSIENGTLYRCLHTYNITNLDSLSKPNFPNQPESYLSRRPQRVILSPLDDLPKPKILYNEASLFLTLNNNSKTKNIQNTPNKTTATKNKKINF